MGMMKELVRRSIKCCETVALGILLKTMPEERVYHAGFHSVDLDVIEQHQEDSHGGLLTSRVLGAPTAKLT